MASCRYFIFSLTVAPPKSWVQKWLYFLVLLYAYPHPNSLSGVPDILPVVHRLKRGLGQDT